jgi:hypothetical protein
MGAVAELPNKITDEAVDKAFNSFATALKLSKTHAQNAAVAALLHCYQHGNAGKLAVLLDFIKTEGKDFVRLAPFTLWLVQYAPVKMVTVVNPEGKKTRVLQFDKESKLIARQDEVIAAATAKLWWTMSQDKEATAFDVVDFDKRILGIARKALADIAAGNAEVSDKVRAHVQATFDAFSLRVTAAKAQANKAAA